MFEYWKRFFLDYFPVLVAAFFFLVLLLAIELIFPDTVADYEVVSPADGVECIVVSRMFNTSVDCWSTDKTHEPTTKTGSTP